MNKKEIFVFILVLATFSLFVKTSVQALSNKEIVEIKKQITKIQKETSELERKLLYAPAGRDRDSIIKKIYTSQLNISELNDKIHPRPKAKKPARVPAGREKIPSEKVTVPFETEEKIGITAPASGERRFANAKFELGLSTGLLGNTAALLGEIRFPMRFVFGPAKTSFRISFGLTQNMEANRRFLPVNFDLIFNFPPGFFTGTQNYLGVGLNYLFLTTGNKAGTLGGELFYGVEGEGFGGMVFGEIGYAIVRTGFSASQKGTTVLIGYRLPVEF